MRAWPLLVVLVACGSNKKFDDTTDGGDGGMLNNGDACTSTCVGNEVHACDGTVMMCDVGKGDVCSNGSCKAGCIAADEQPSNVGCEFWAVDLDNEYSQFNDAAGAPWGVVLSNASQAPANVTIETKKGVVTTMTIPAGTLKEVILPTLEVDGSTMGKDEGPGTFVSPNAYRITSNVPLVAYQFNTMKQSFSNDASLLLPRNALGSVYRVIGWPTANPIAPIPTPGIPDHSFVTIVGVATQTNVTVTLGGDIVGGGGIMATKKGGTVKMTLDPYEVLNLESDGIPGDLTGTTVESSAPVVVFTGGERGIAPYDTPNLPKPPNYDPMQLCCTDHLEEQLLPITSAGKKFVVARSPVRSKGSTEPDILRFQGLAQTVTIQTNLPPPDNVFTLKAGEMRETWTVTDFTATGNAPFAIAQILVSQGYTSSPDVGGDPSLTIFPPVDQYRANYLFLVPTSWVKNIVALSIPDGGTVSIDGKPLGSCDTASAGTVDGTPYTAQRCVVSEGVHRLQGNKPFGLVAYGYGPAGSYAFVGGADVKKIYEPPPLH